MEKQCLIKLIKDLSGEEIIDNFDIFKKKYIYEKDCIIEEVYEYDRMIFNEKIKYEELQESYLIFLFDKVFKYIRGI